MPQVVTTHIVDRFSQIAGVPAEELRARLTQLLDANLIYESCLFPDLEGTFRHALIHEVTYQGLVRGPASSLHARIVSALEAVPPMERARAAADRCGDLGP